MDISLQVMDSKYYIAASLHDSEVELKSKGYIDKLF